MSVRSASRLVTLLVVAAGLVVFEWPAPAGAAGAGEVRLASHTPGAPVTAADNTSANAVVSADGNFVAFVSFATDLVSGQSDANLAMDVFLFARATGSVTLVSRTATSASTTSNSSSETPVISADGSFVAFKSGGTNLVAGQNDSNGNFDVFLFERATGTVTLVSHAISAAATAANAPSDAPSMSANGGFVTFQSAATNLVAGQVDANSNNDAFVFDRSTGANSLVSHAPGSAVTAANNFSEFPVISANGAFVAFASAATNLVGNPAADMNSGRDVFLFERATATNTLASHLPASSTATANGEARFPSISGDGAFLVFGSYTTNIVAGQTDTNVEPDVFLFSRATGAVTLVSHVPGSNTTAGNKGSPTASIATGGAFVTFESRATDLVPSQSDANNERDIFLYDRATGTVTLVSHAANASATTANAYSISPAVSADGGFVAFTSPATNVVTGQTETVSGDDVFLFERTTGTSRLVSHTPGSTTATAGGFSTFPSVSSTGAFVAFLSQADNLVTGQVDGNGDNDAFLFQRSASRTAVADFDGNGATDVAVFRPSSGIWFVQGGATVAWGTSGDIPVPGDYDGNGTTDIAVFRPSSGIWFVKGVTTNAWGTSGDIPVPGDYDGNGTTDFAVFRPSSGTWFVQGGATVAWGTSGDIPVPGDYDGNGATEFAVFRPSSGTWFVQGGVSGAWGTSGDIPVPGDYDGSGTTDVAVFRPSAGLWFVQGRPTVAWGVSGDVPLPLPDAIRRAFFPPP